MNTLYLVNIKCSGCARTVKESLEKEGFKNIEVYFTENDSHLKRKVTFEGSIEKAKIILEEKGYPEYGTEKANDYIKKAKSFVSCAVGTIKNSIDK